MPPANGSSAPDFSLHDTERKVRTLGEFRGKNVVLAFFPGAFTRVCTKEMCTFQESLTSLNNLNAQLIGISVDAPAVNKAFAERWNLTFPILSDYSRRVSKQYGGVYQNFLGMPGYEASKRAIFVIDERGKVLYTWIGEDSGLEPPYDEISRILEAAGTSGIHVDGTANEGQTQSR